MSEPPGAVPAETTLTDSSPSARMRAAAICDLPPFFLQTKTTLLGVLEALMTAFSATRVTRAAIRCRRGAGLWSPKLAASNHKSAAASVTRQRGPGLHSVDDAPGTWGRMGRCRVKTQPNATMAPRVTTTRISTRPRTRP
ncbi:hypothetical protein ACFPRL_12885 [Pseudoclavibacter helvolus]